MPSASDAIDRLAGLAASCLAVLCLAGCDDAPPPVSGGGPDRGPGSDMATPCEGAVEECNGRDDDCDGRVDEQVSEAGMRCGGENGCGVGTRTCRDGALVCVGAGAPSPERCNAEDDDCDGIVDEEAMGVGDACAACEGTYRCMRGDLVCSGGMAETCNGLDDDCDGRTDEALVQDCGEDIGACEPGQMTCTNGMWGGCNGGVGPNGEQCNGIDDDCDGIVDEGLADCNGLGTPCGGDAECSTGLCLDDDGSFYCSRPCNMAAPDDCGEGNVCVEIGERTVCIPRWPACTDDCGCPDGTACMPAINLPDVTRACRPERRGGLPVGAECDFRDDRCATGTCLQRTGRCARLCCDQASCAGDPGTHCVDLPGVEQPICQNGCTADSDCPPYAGLGPDDPVELCRFRANVEMTANVGVCDWPNRDGQPIGGPCERGADCAHGLCWRPVAADNYCTKGCVTAEDCPDGWRCAPTELNGLDAAVCRQD